MVKLLDNLPYLSIVGIIILCIIIFIEDIKNMIIPNRYNILLLLFAIFYRGFMMKNIENGIIGAGIYTLPLIFIYGYVSDILKKDAIGFGDIKLMISFGYILKYKYIVDIYFYYLIAFVLGGVFSILIIIIYKNTKKEIPFAPFLIITFLYFFIRETFFYV